MQGWMDGEIKKVVRRKEEVQYAGMHVLHLVTSSVGDQP